MQRLLGPISKSTNLRVELEENSGQGSANDFSTISQVNMLVGEHRMIGELQDEHPKRTCKSSCYQEDTHPNGGGRLGEGRGMVFTWLYIRKPNQQSPKTYLKHIPRSIEVGKTMEIHANLVFTG